MSLSNKQFIIYLLQSYFLLKPSQRAMNHDHLSDEITNWLLLFVAELLDPRFYLAKRATSMLVTDVGDEMCW